MWGLAAAVKQILYLMLEAYLFTEVADETADWLKKQQMLIALEGEAIDPRKVAVKLVSRRSEVRSLLISIID